MMYSYIRRCTADMSSNMEPWPFHRFTSVASFSSANNRWNLRSTYRIASHRAHVKLSYARRRRKLMKCVKILHLTSRESASGQHGHAGLPRIRFHDLRHTASTVLLQQRVNPKIVSEMLGHASISITLDLYSHALPDIQQESAAAMDAVFGSD